MIWPAAYQVKSSKKTTYNEESAGSYGDMKMGSWRCAENEGGR